MEAGDICATRFLYQLLQFHILTSCLSSNAIAQATCKFAIYQILKCGSGKQICIILEICIGKIVFCNTFQAWISCLLFSLHIQNNHWNYHLSSLNQISKTDEPYTYAVRESKLDYNIHLTKHNSFADKLHNPSIFTVKDILFSHEESETTYWGQYKGFSSTSS